jgi:hypothetical protein
MALAHAKYFKEETKKDKSKSGGNPTSISCGGITLKFEGNENSKAFYENQYVSRTSKHPKAHALKTGSELSNKDKTLESQHSS